MVTTLYLIRHCQSMGNIQHRFQGRFDAPVSPDGEKQLELLSLRFRNEKIDAVYSSPLLRAVRTAQAVARFSGLPIRIEEGFIEIDVGEMENLELSQIGKRFPETARNWDQSPDLCCFPGGETMQEVYRRVNDTLDQVIEKNRGKQVVVVTHGGVLRNLYARVAFGCLEGIRKSEVFGNTGVSVLKAAEGKGLFFEKINDLSHLPSSLQRPPTKYSFEQVGNEPV